MLLVDTPSQPHKAQEIKLCPISVGYQEKEGTAPQWNLKVKSLINASNLTQQSVAPSMLQPQEFEMKDSNLLAVNVPFPQQIGGPPFRIANRQRRCPKE